MESRSELRLVTCLFVDIVGSTDLGQRLGPERMQQMLAESFREISAIALAEGGTIEKYIGDEVFVLFGAPSSHADDVARALRTGEASVRWAASRQIGVRAGIETGEALVDLDAVPERQRMAVGACVNIAARLQQQADTGEVVVGPMCRAAARDLAEFADVGVRTLKGLGEIPVYRLVRTVEARPAELPLVGREPELARLRQAFARARARLATFAVVTGPPGIGKSRVLREFAKDVAAEAVVLTARVRPGTETGSSPLRQLLPSDDVTAIPAAVAHSAGLRADAGLLALAPVDRRNEIHLGWLAYLSDIARDRPALVCVEDLHWAESELVRLFDRLTFDTELPLMVVATARPEFPGMPLIRAADDRVVIELQPLDADAAARLARAAGGRDLAARAEGNPLFIVELSRASAASSDALPLTVQAAIGARLDELPPRERELLQTAAVIGETFDVRGVALLSERDPAEVTGTLARLAHLRYVEPVDGRYRFHHALAYDVAYSRVPASARLPLHARYARDGLRRDDVEAAAHHWWQALGPPDGAWVWEGHRERESMLASAVDAHIAAGRALGDRFAFERASEVFDRALQLAATPRDRARVEEAFAVACRRNAMGNDSVDHLLRASELYREAGEAPPVALYADMLDLITFNWGYFKRLPAYEQVMRLLDDGIAAARASDDAANLFRLLVQRGFFTNDATVLGEASGLIARAGDLRAYADALWRMSLVHFTVSKDIGRALEALDRAFALAREGAHFNLPEALMWRSCAHFHAGDLDAAEADADQLRAIGKTLSPHTRQHGLGAKGRILFARGDWAGVGRLADDLRALVRENEDATFCVIGANLAAHGAVAEALTRGTLPDDLDALTARLIPQAAATRAATLFLPRSLAGRPEAEADARRAYTRETPIWDRQQVWDVTETQLALAYVAAARWPDVERMLPNLDQMGRRGARFASALAGALREELAAAAGGPRPAHTELHHLGCHGISDLLAYRAGSVAVAG